MSGRPASASFCAKEIAEDDSVHALRETDRANIHMARAFVGNPEVLVFHRPFSHYHGYRDFSELRIALEGHVEERGFMMTPIGVNARRPRTVFFSSDYKSAERIAHTVWNLPDAENPKGFMSVPDYETPKNTSKNTVGLRHSLDSEDDVANSNQKTMNQQLRIADAGSSAQGDPLNFRIQPFNRTVSLGTDFFNQAPLTRNISPGTDFNFNQAFSGLSSMTGLSSTESTAFNKAFAGAQVPNGSLQNVSSRDSSQEVAYSGEDSELWPLRRKRPQNITDSNPV
jgi:hypothetical protein